MGKVFENDAHKIIAYSDDGKWKFKATRRSTKKNVAGKIMFVGSYWTIEFFVRKADGWGFEPTAYPLYRERFNKKQDVIELFKDSKEFSQAYKEMTA